MPDPVGGPTDPQPPIDLVAKVPLTWCLGPQWRSPDPLPHSPLSQAAGRDQKSMTRAAKKNTAKSPLSTLATLLLGAVLAGGAIKLAGAGIAAKASTNGEKAGPVSKD